jgi:hypothetical protein
VSFSQPHASKSYAAFVLLNDAFADPQTQTSAFRLLRAKEWLEYLFRVLWLYAVARIVDRDSHSFTTGTPFSGLE